MSSGRPAATTPAPRPVASARRRRTPTPPLGSRPGPLHPGRGGPRPPRQRHGAAPGRGTAAPVTKSNGFRVLGIHRPAAGRRYSARVPCLIGGADRHVADHRVADRDACDTLTDGLDNAGGAARRPSNHAQSCSTISVIIPAAIALSTESAEDASTLRTSTCPAWTSGVCSQSASPVGACPGHSLLLHACVPYSLRIAASPRAGITHSASSGRWLPHLRDFKHRL